MHDPAFLIDVLTLLVAAVVIVATFRTLKMSPVLGYLVAGAAIGPFGLGIIRDVESTAAIAEMGVVFLLFLIGLELSFDRLRAMRRHVFGLGSLQVILTGVLIAATIVLSGGALEVAMVVGFSLAMSSTAVVLQVLNERGEQASKVGRLSLAILILQDFAVVPLLILIPLLSHHSGDELVQVVGTTLFKAMVALVLIFIVGRVCIRPLFKLVAGLRSPELFAAATLIVVLGAAFATQHFGLSMALGAFVAGLLVAETEYEHQVEADILPFKGLFLGLFFMSVGMGVDSALMLNKLPLILILTTGLIALKTSVIMLLCKLYGIRLSNALRTGLMLAQGGEFAFILFTMAAKENVLDSEWAQLLMVVVTMTMALTPPLAALGRFLSKRIEKKSGAQPNNAVEEISDLTNHVIIAGFGKRGQLLAKLLDAEKIPYVAIDTDPRHVTEARAKLLPVYYGDASRTEVLHAVGAERAELIVFTFGNARFLERSVTAVRQTYPDLQIVTRAGDGTIATQLRTLGAHRVVDEPLEAGLQLGAALLRKRGIVEHEVQRVVETLRAREK